MKLLKLSIWKCRRGVRAWQTEAIPAALDMAFWMCRVEVCDFRERQYHMQRISNEPKAAKKKARN